MGGAGPRHARGAGSKERGEGGHDRQGGGVDIGGSEGERGAHLTMAGGDRELGVEGDNIHERGSSCGIKAAHVVSLPPPGIERTLGSRPSSARRVAASRSRASAAVCSGVHLREPSQYATREVLLLRPVQAGGNGEGIMIARWATRSRAISVRP